MGIRKFEFLLLCVLIIFLLLTLFLILNNTYNLRLINSKYKNKFDIYEIINHKKQNLIKSQNTLQLNLLNLLKNHKKRFESSNKDCCKKDYGRIFENKIIPSVKKLFIHEKRIEEEHNENKTENDIRHYDYDDDNLRWSYI